VATNILTVAMHPSNNDDDNEDDDNNNKWFNFNNNTYGTICLYSKKLDS
jgi:hypothetical protein